jgi:hypothetical protein
MIPDYINERNILWFVRNGYISLSDYKDWIYDRWYNGMNSVVFDEWN